eukprot:COSAG05_NODE_1874_length_3915_cov_3.202306_1_plen_66_part_00
MSTTKCSTLFDTVDLVIGGGIIVRMPPPSSSSCDVSSSAMMMIVQQPVAQLSYATQPGAPRRHSA